MSKLVACLSGALVTLASASGASAQSNSTSADAAGLELEEVVVTAERVTKDLQKVSQVINVTSGEQLKKEGKIRIDEILQGITGVQLQSDQVDTNIYMRGVSTGVPLLVDGVSQGAGPAARNTTLDIAQVAVARGVQNGAGTTSLTGSVSLVTNKPAFEYQASGSLSVGSYELRNTEGVLNLPITDNQAVRVAYSADRRNGYISSDAGNSDNRQFRLRYRWMPSENLDIVASFQEGRTEGNGVSQSTLLYTGHWIDYTAGDSVAWTNPYTGTTSVWGQTQPTANRFFLAGQVNAANSVTPTTGQTTYNAGPCSGNTEASNSSGTRTAGSVTTFNWDYLGPLITSMGCPARQLAIRDGVYFNQRSNPWDDGFGAYEWSNSPVRNTIQRQANVIIDWTTSYGKWTIQPAYVYNLNNFVEPARGTSWMVQGGIPSNSERLDVQLASNSDGKLQWVTGFNGTYTPRADQGTTFTTIAMPTAGWDTMTGMSATVGTSCYTVLPGTNPATAAGDVGIANSSQCNTVNYSAPGKSYNYGLSLQGGYPVLDNLRLNGSVRKDWYTSENRGAAFDTLIDGSGQRYVWYIPTTTGTGGNTGLVVPYRMNISQADLDAMVNSVHSWRKSNTESYTFNVEYDFLPSTMLYAKYATGATGAMAAAMGGASGGTLNLALPNAVVPGTTTSYVTAITLPAPSVKGETTQQISLGLKSRWFDNKLQVNVEAFDNKYKNRPLGQILSGLYNYANGVTGNPTCTATATQPIISVLGTALTNSCFATNIGNFTGDLRSRGVDMDVTFVPTANDRLDLAVEYLRTTFEGVPEIAPITANDVLASATSGSNATLAAFFADNYNNFLAGVDGQTLPNAPRWSVNFNYQHQFELPGGSRLVPRVTAYYKSAVYFNESLQNGSSSNIVESNWAIANDRWLPSIQPGYTLFDFYTTWQPKDGKWSLSGYVKNIENEPILSSTGGLTTISTGSMATNDLYRVVTGGYANLNAPRTFGLTLSANF
ncbi:MAG: TonB-dependent receptor [Steroidobacteraceae bacterium]